MVYCTITPLTGRVGAEFVGLGPGPSQLTQNFAPISAPFHRTSGAGCAQRAGRPSMSYQTTKTTQKKRGSQREDVMANNIWRPTSPSALTRRDVLAGSAALLAPLPIARCNASGSDWRQGSHDAGLAHRHGAALARSAGA